MKAVMLSLRPQWCEKIFNGEKTIEVRKTRPNIPPPFDVLVYCTKHSLTKTECMNSYLHKNEPKACKKYGEITTWCSIGDVQVNSNTPWSFRSYGMHGKVIGSFVCDRIREIIPLGLRGFKLGAEWLKEMCLSKEQLDEYGGLKTLYSWHITEPQLFEKPRDITEFALYGKCAEDCDEYDICARDSEDGRMSCKYFKRTFLERPPQSYCFVETDEK